MQLGGCESQHCSWVVVKVNTQCVQFSTWSWVVLKVGRSRRAVGWLCKSTLGACSWVVVVKVNNRFV